MKFFTAIACIGLALPPAAIGVAAERLADIAGFQAARWGMSEAELEQAFGPALKRLPAPWEYAGAYAAQALFDVEFAGLAYTALFQMDAATRRLQQVLLERRRPKATPAAYESALVGLTRILGSPDGTCAVPKVEREPMIAGAVWRFPTTTVHARFLDFHTIAVFGEDPNRDRDVRAPSPERGRNNWRFMPRRVIVRFHPTARADLAVDPCNTRNK